ncbi:MAG: UDP-N-acetylmuramoyl-L-alanyl-D-glutamate--2,6-diaminopimelate ligase [Alphaproteobacteria bacterium]|nr:UDP-N-acetylmuramoyl-L-alanyl-D-glutamate--2,6-diaminopimelate ligase [Alphaproteobacteria bacterium]
MDLTSFITNGTLTFLSGELTFPTSLSMNSKTVKEGDIFVAIPGSQHDGIIFIGEALERGANSIVTQGMDAKKLIRLQEQYPEVAFFETHNARKTLSLLAAAFYPLQPDNSVAVTGTNGKTSVVSFIRQIWAHLGFPAASLGTLGLVVANKPNVPFREMGDTNTPNAIALHEILQNLKEEHIEHVAFEASSHGLHQHRLDSVKLKAAVFTNLSNDHLDYHETLESYFEAKARLFKELIPKHGYAILNADIAEYETLYSLCRKRKLQTITFGKAGKTIRLISITPGEGAQDIHLSVEGKSYELTLPFVGQFQVYNVMAALGAVMACGGNQEQAVQACTYLKSVPGRLEQVVPRVYVDFAHTPDALFTALKALRPHTKGKLWVVFGCGGNRDTSKRPMMGEIADRLADEIIITDDNPRHEDPAKIRQEILAKCSRASEGSSRHHAIQTAVEGMDLDDVVLIAGKGPENYQIVGDLAVPFNDSEEIRKYVR